MLQTNQPNNPKHPDGFPNLTGNPSSAARCGAKTRNGGSCKSPAVRGNKRCRMHGGKGSGAPTRNRNAWRHGDYATSSKMLRWYAQFLMDWANGIYSYAGESVPRGAPARKHFRRALSNIELIELIELIGILRMCELDDVADELEAKYESGKRKIAIR